MITEDSACAKGLETPFYIPASNPAPCREEMNCHFPARMAGWGIKEGLKFSGAFIGVILIIAGIVYAWKEKPRITINRKTWAQATATSIATAVDQYYTEYNKLPGVAGRVTTDKVEGIRLLNILNGDESRDAAAENERFIRFLSLREGRDDRRGVIYDSTGSGAVVGLYDEWGSPYTVFLDGDGDGVLEFKLGSKEVRLEGRRAAVVSPGKDGKLGTPDDIKTW